MKDKVKKVHRMLPCPAYDIEGVESWLEDMAKEGLLLDKKSPFGSSFLRFVPAMPQKVRYRLEPKVKGLEHNWEPPEEARGLAANYGWEFVCAFEMFYIYRTVRAHAPEMNTDNLVQAASLKRLKKDLVSSLFCQFVTAGFALSSFGREPFRFLVTFGSIYVVLFVLFFLGAVWTAAFRLHHILRLRKKLKSNIPTNHNKDWKKGAFLHKAVRVSSLSLWLLALAAIFSTFFSVMSLSKSATEDYPGEPPFVTVSDLYPGCSFGSAGLDDLYNYYQQMDSDCCNAMIDWREFVKIFDENGDSLGTATMIVQYYETNSPWLAKGLAQDFLRRDTRWKGVDTLEQLPAPELGLDHIMVYKAVVPSIILQHGNVMVHATMTNEALLYRWAEEMAQMLK